MPRKPRSSRIFDAQHREDSVRPPKAKPSAPVPVDRGVGVGVDAQGGAVIDPTANVIALSEAQTIRQDDLRTAFEKRFEEALGHVNEVSRMRARHNAEIGEIRAEYGEKLSAAESKRLDAIRAVDISAVSTAADRAAQAIQALALQTQSNAENLRTALNTTATTIANQTAATVQAITERIAALEKSSYEGKGRSMLGDPMVDQLRQEVERLRAVQAMGSGQRQGASNLWGYILGAVGLIGAIMAILTRVK